MSQKIRSSALVLVLSILFVSSAYALPPAQAVAGPRAQGFLAAAWDWFAALVLPVPSARTPGMEAIWGQAGSSMDPDGQTVPGNFLSGDSTEAGSQMDPNGHS